MTHVILKEKGAKFHWYLARHGSKNQVGGWTIDIALAQRVSKKAAEKMVETLSTLETLKGWKVSSVKY